MSVEKKVPEVRFKGFSGKWAKRKMFDCASKIGDGLHGTPKYTDNTGIYFINGNNLVSGSILITDETKQVSIDEQSKNDNSLDLNTLLLSINGTIGNLAWYQGEHIMLGKSVAFIKLENCNNSYMYAYMQTVRIKNHFLNSLTGSTIKNLGLKAIRESTVVIPEEHKEQIAIGNYFQKLDALINQHQQKHDKLNSIKKAMLEKMFPKQGETMPEIRFKGFSGEWDYLSLGENAKFTKGQGYSKGDLVTSGSPIILYGRLYTKYQTVITGVDTFVTEKDKSIKSIGGEVIVPASGESPEDISRASVISEPNVIIGGDLNIVLPSKKIHSTFLALAISNGRLKKKLSSKAQGKSVVHIRNSDLADLDLILPTEYMEQIAISNYFQNLDALISRHQQQITKLSNIKQACLSKMFV